MPEVRLIDANALKDKISSLKFRVKSSVMMAGLVDMKAAALREIENAPTIEPEVRHGRWIEESANEYYCSYCGKYAPIVKNMRHCDCSKWCKECGTKMDGGDSNAR